MILQKSVKMSKSDNINVIVVGAGYGGLATAIELTRKGCKVKVFEAAKSLAKQGTYDDCNKTISL